MTPTIEFDSHAQGTDGWLAARRGRITGSRFRDALDHTAKGDLTAAARLYAMDVARERCGGTAPAVYVNAAMRTGVEQEPLARAAYEAQTGRVVLTAGFAGTTDGRFGVSVDGLVGDDGIVEIKTIVSSATLFRAVVDRDISDYTAQIEGGLWLLGRQWCDLILWAPDLVLNALTIVRVQRDEAAVEKLAASLLEFDGIVENYFQRLCDAPFSGLSLQDQASTKEIKCHP